MSPLISISSLTSDAACFEQVRSVGLIRWPAPIVAHLKLSVGVRTTLNRSGNATSAKAATSVLMT